MWRVDNREFGDTQPGAAIGYQYDFLLEGIGLQLLWLAVLVAVGRTALARAAVHASILGG